MTNNPLVTIKCVAYNEAAYIRRTLDGFVKQRTNFPFIALVHDDASTDGTDEIIREYAAKYPKIIYGLYEEKGNNLFSRHMLDKKMNEWVFETGCKYVAMCEGDDFWIDPLKLQKQVDYMEQHPNCSLCYTDCHTANEAGLINYDFLMSKHLSRPKNFLEHLFNAGYIAPPTWLYRADISMEIGSYDAYTDDTFAMALDLFQHGMVHYMDDVTAVYTIRSGSVVNQQDIIKHWIYVHGIFETQLSMAKKYNCSSEIICKLCFQGYADNLLLALEAEDDEFIKEALEYYHSQGMEMKWFAEKCKRYVLYHQQYEMIRKSKAYKLGKFLLKPLKWLKR